MDNLIYRINHGITEKLLAKIEQTDSMCSECQMRPKKHGELCAYCWQELEGNNP